MSTDPGGFGVYVHWPFCAAKCPYCDFNSHVRGTVDQDRWAAALVRGLDRAAARTPGRVVGSVFFGGGTPSLMAPRVVGAALDAIARLWPAANDVEVTLEANPGSVDAGNFAGYAAAGVNRVSLGVQALDDADLRRLGRLHSAAEARTAMDIARGRFGRVSCDLIYARQDQGLEAWARELDQALRIGVDHLSLYQLTIEPGTAFGALHARGRLRGLPADDLAADMYALTQERTAAAGLPAYEISNHARAGAECRHNLVYWRYGEFVGVGPGAHGRIASDGARLATAAVRSPEDWLAAVEAGGDGWATAEQVPGGEQAEEYLMMALRLDEGASLERYRALGGAVLPPERLDGLVGDGLLAVAGDRVTATGRGRLLLNAVLRALLA